MNSATTTFRLYRQSGVTLIELLIAMVLGLIVAGGIISVFISTSNSNRIQTQMAQLQEEGRFAITTIKNDLRMANGQYCNNSGGVAKAAAQSQVYLDGLRSPKVYAKNITLGMADVTTIAASVTAASAAYSFPSFLSMRGYDCDKTTCKPVNPGTTIMPAMGTDVGKRVKSTDAITVRYVDPSRGWPIDGINTSIASSSSVTNAIDSITLAPASSSGPPASDFLNGDLAMLADCSNAQVFATTRSGSKIYPDAGKNNGAPAPQKPQSAPMLFDFNRDYKTVTYYLRVVDIGRGQKSGALIRRVNGGAGKPGGSEDELVRGVERLDFRYGVQDVNGKVRFLNADQVDKATGITCPPQEPDAITSDGCLWRAVSSIEVNLVMDGQAVLPALSATDLPYSYSIDGNSTPAAPTAHAVKPSDQGFADKMIRREFTALVSVRNFNP